jgi:hypothetical protein
MQSYAQAYTEEVPAMGHHYAKVFLARFTPTSADTDLDLFNAMAEQSNAPRGGMNMVISLVQGDPKVLAMHRPHKFAACTYDVATSWNGKCLVFNGDIVSDQVPQAWELPRKLFEVKTLDTPKKVPTWPIAVAYARAHPTDAHYPIIEDTVAADQYDTVTACRRGIYVPPLFVSATLGNRGRRTIREHLLGVDEVLQTETAAAGEYRVLQEWLLLAYTEGGRSHIQRGSLPHSPISDPTLVSATRALVRMDLPGWGYVPPVNPPAAARVPPVPPVQTARVPKTPSEKWPAAIELLLKLLLRENEKDIPKVFFLLAATSSKEEARTVLTNHLRLVGAKLKLFHNVVVTKEVFEVFYNFTFASPNGIEDLTRGLQPFVVAYTTSEAETQKRLTADLSFHAQLTGAEVKMYKENLVAAIPTNAETLRKTLSAFEVLLFTAHDNDIVYQAYKKHIMDKLPHIEEFLDRYVRAGNPNAHGSFAQAIHIMMHDLYFVAITEDGYNEPPAFEGLVQSLRSMMWTPSFLPTKVATPPAPQQGGRGVNADDGGPAVGGTGRKTNPDKHPRLAAFGR